MSMKAAFFSENRRKLVQRLQADGIEAPIIIAAHGMLQRSADTTFPFQQDSSFWYLTGINIPDLIVVLHKGEEFIIVPKRDTVRETFDGAINTKKLESETGIKVFLDDTEGWRKIDEIIKKTKKFATFTPGPSYYEKHGFYANPARNAFTSRMNALGADLEAIDIKPVVATMRMIKQPDEIRALQKAIDITTDTLLEIAKPERLKSYKYEYELEADVTRGFRFRGARGHGFDPIVAGGMNATTLHYIDNNSPLSADDLVILDVGAAKDGYAADISATVSLSCNPTKRQLEVYAAVADVQNYAYGLLKPGTLLKEYEKAVEVYMGDVLQGLGLIEKTDHENIRKYFPHAVSHFLGIDVHDIGDYSLPLQPGVVMTVEPGIYIPDEKLGVRIEDDVLLTDTGIEILSRRMSKSLV